MISFVLALSRNIRMMLSKHVSCGCGWVWVAILIVSVAPHPTSVLAFTPPLPSVSVSKHPMLSSEDGQPTMSPFLGPYRCKQQGHRCWAVPPQVANFVERNDAQDLGDDLTKQELNIRFWEVRDYYRQNPDEMTQADVCLKLLSTRLPNIRLHRCFVAPSTVVGAGNGLFASRDIANDELITMYPGDAVLIQSPSTTPPAPAPAAPSPENTKSPPDSPPVVGVMFGSHIQGQDRIPNQVTTPEARSYEMEINKYTSIVADPQIGFKDPAYLGHFANDGEALYEFDAASREIYSKASVERHNAAHFVMEGAHMVTVATKPVAKGEEIFVSYGEGYWLSRSFSMSDMDATEKNAIVVEMASAKSSSTFYNLSSPGNDSSNGRSGGTSIAKGRKKKKKDAPSKGMSRGFGK